MNRIRRYSIALKLYIAAAAFFLAGAEVKATPYASCITNTGGMVSFILNEDATNSVDGVKIIYDGGGPGNTNDMGGLARGPHSFSMAGHTTYEIHVTKSSLPAWTKYSVDTNKYNQYFSPGGIGINRNPADLSLFGKIYVAENVGGNSTTKGQRTDGDGLYVVNPDFTDALGYDDTAMTGGLFFQGGNVAEGQKSPWKVTVGEDGYVYISDWSVASGTVYRMSPDLLTGEVVLDQPGAASNPTVHTTCNGSVIAKGSLTNGTLQIWTIDGQWPSGGFNRLLRYDIFAGPLPYNSPPAAVLRTAGVASVVDVSADLDIAPDGKFFLTSFRATGSAGAYVADRVNLRVLDTDGLTVKWDSLSNSLAIGQTEDVFSNTRSVAVSPDGKKMALAHENTHVWIMDLTNGIPNIATRTNIDVFGFTSTSTTSTVRREIAFDAAGNLYAGNNSTEVIVVYSPGGAKTAITKSDGTFQIATPATTVSVSASVATANEAGLVNGQYTISRVGDTSGSLTVTYTMSGTASNGVDYTTLPGSVTLLPGATSTNVTLATIDDSVVEATETAIMTLSGNPNYAISAGSATVSILDNETPEVSMTVGQTNLLECFAGAKVTFTVSRKGLLASAFTVNLSYGGTAAKGVDYAGPSSVTFAANALSTNFTITPIDDLLLEGTETVTVSAITGTGYTIGSPLTQTAAIIDDEVLPGIVMFSDNFNTNDPTGNWMINYSDGGADTFADFGFDYGAVGIPEAPHTTGASLATRGLKLHVNEVFTQVAGISVSPMRYDSPDFFAGFQGDYKMSFDFWMNYVGPLPAGGAGSTEHMSAGIGTSGFEPVWPSGFDGSTIWFTAASDADVADTSTAQADYGAFIGNSLQPVISGSYAAGQGADARGNGNAYYSVWGDVAAPAAQLTLFPVQTGRTRVGCLGMAWHCMTIAKHGTNVTCDIDGRRLGAVDATGIPFDNNVFIGFHDWFASISANPLVEFVVYDNIKVETLGRPTLSTLVPINGGTEVQLDFAAEAEDASTAFELESAPEVTGPYMPITADITALGGNRFRATATVAATAGQQFYRLHRL